MAGPTSRGHYDLTYGRRVMPAYIHGERCWPQVDKLSPCEAGCPLHVDIPDYVMAIAENDPDKALSIIREKNPLASICGYLCWHPCEDECNRKVVDDPIAIQWLKWHAVENGNGGSPSAVPRTREERVAVVGAGPAGLTAAFDLVKKGYGVTVFEAGPAPGGLPATTIPDFILPLEAVQADIEYIKSLGVEILTSVSVGKDISVSGLLKQGFKAVLIAAGSGKGAGSKVPGSDLSGVYSALTFLQEAKQGKAAPISGKVWVIGGDHIAMAAARTALRLGADEVHVACLEAKGDRSHPGNIPTVSWLLEAAEKEGVQIHTSLAAQKYTAGKGSNVGGISFKRVIPLPTGGKGKIHRTQRGFPLVEVEGPEGDYTVAADVVIDAADIFTAKRQVPDLSDLLGKSPKTGKAASLTVSRDTFETNVPGVFVVGDTSGTGGQVVDSMADGRTAATSIDQFLRGQYVIPVKDNRDALVIEEKQIPVYFNRKERWEMPELQAKQAVKTFQAVNLGYSNWQAVEEAKRCMNCRMCANCIFERHQQCVETATRLLKS